jgi:hypothetical protein
MPVCSRFDSKALLFGENAGCLAVVPGRGDKTEASRNLAGVWEAHVRF